MALVLTYNDYVYKTLTPYSNFKQFQSKILNDINNI